MIGIMATDSVLKIICDNSGSVEYNRLLEITSCMPELDCLDGLLQNSNCFAVIEQHGSKNVIVSTNLKLCKIRECQNNCKDLHLCKFFILGECNRRQCNYSHSLKSEHNSRVLSDRNLQSLSKDQLRTLLLHSDSSLLPHICVSYNKGSGEYGNCPDKEACNRLHVCENYIRGTCEGTTDCSRSHDFYEPHPRKTLQDKRVPNQLMGSLNLIYRNILTLRHRSSGRGETATKSQDYTKFSNKGKVPESLKSNAEKMICLSFVKGYCKFGDNCWRIHFDVPYKWEVEVDQVWIDLPDNELIERQYCDPTKIHSVGIEPVFFDTMTQGLHRVRRLTTLSSVVEPTFELTTKWTWYWEDEYRTWIKYGSGRERHRLSSISSEDLEQKYIHFLKESNNPVVKFTAGKQCYEINFTDMKQRNQLTGMERTVRRRPVFVSSSNVQTIRTTRKRGAHSSSYKGFPGFWDKTAIPESGYQRVLLSPSDKDYIRVQEHFQKTMKNSIVSIERVQNKELWEDFQTKRERMKKANKDKKYGEGERLLFHGTKSTHTDAICRQNFDIRVSGANGTVYGQGSYFARDAKYSHSYTEEYGDKCMFACRVLVGQYTKGAAHYRRPPARDAAGTLYDSCVNDVRDPTIYVVFDRPQIYPEFLITYKEYTFTDAFSGYTLGHSTLSDIVPTSNPTTFLDISQTVSPNSAATGVNMSKTASMIPTSSSQNVHALSSSPVSTGQVLPSPNSTTVSDPLMVLDSTPSPSKDLPSGQRKSDYTVAKTPSSCPVLTVLQREDMIHPKVTPDSANLAQYSSAGLPAKSSQDLLTPAEVIAFSRLHDLSLNSVKPSLSVNAAHSEDAKDQNTGSSDKPTSNSASMPDSQSTSKDFQKSSDSSVDSNSWVLLSELGAGNSDLFLTGLDNNVSFSTGPTLAKTHDSSFSRSSRVSFSQANSSSFSSTHKPSTITNPQQARGYTKPSPPKHAQKKDCVLQ